MSEDRAEYVTDERVSVIHGDCIEQMRAMADNSVDAIVTDPPYGLEFMGKDWDSFGKETLHRSFARSGNNAPRFGAWTPTASEAGIKKVHQGNLGFQAWCQEWATEALRVLKPGGHLLAMGGTRTYHRLACAIEDAGFEVRDSLTWLHGQGFPKNLDVGKALDKEAGAERKITTEGPTVRRLRPGADQNKSGSWEKLTDRTFTHTESEAATDEAKQWDGWGTALKPAAEFILLARKPLAGTVVANVLEHGVGALNIDGCRVETSDNLDGGAYSEQSNVARNSGSWRGERKSDSNAMRNAGLPGQYTQPQGRWPANVVLSHTEDCRVVGTKKIKGDNREGSKGARQGGFVDTGAESGDPEPNGPLYGDAEVDVWDCSPECPVRLLDQQSGVLKSGRVDKSRQHHDNRIFGAPPKHATGIFEASEGGASRFFYTAKASRSERGEGNNHPTVKPVSLLRWLVRLVTPPNGLVLDPFCGSGTTLIACIQEGFRCTGIEQNLEYVEIARKRLNGVQGGLGL